MDRLSGKDELFAIVKRIPYGRCAGYGSLGRFLQNPVSGYIAGRWMASCPEGVPWWRVVAKDGTLVVARRDPALGIRQRELLEKEGVRFEDGRAIMDEIRWDPSEEL